MDLSARALRAEGSSSHHRPRPAGSSWARCSYWCIGGPPVGSCGPTRHWNCSPSVHQVRCVLAAHSFSTCSHPSALPPAYCCGKEFLVPWRPVPPCLPHATPSPQLASVLSRPRPRPAGSWPARRPPTKGAVAVAPRFCGLDFTLETRVLLARSGAGPCGCSLAYTSNLLRGVARAALTLTRPASRRSAHAATVACHNALSRALLPGCCQHCFLRLLPMLLPGGACHIPSPC